jgi:hypothetical protein
MPTIVAAEPDLPTTLGPDPEADRAQLAIATDPGWPITSNADGEPDRAELAIPTGLGWPTTPAAVADAGHGTVRAEGRDK